MVSFINGSTKVYSPMVWGIGEKKQNGGEPSYKLYYTCCYVNLFLIMYLEDILFKKIIKKLK